MVICECPLCDKKIRLNGYEEYDLLECPGCGTELEIVSLSPPVLEASFKEDDEDWNDVEDVW